MIKIAVDAMGGDKGLEITIPGVVKALDINSKIEVILFGDENRVCNYLRIQDNISLNILSRIQISHIEDKDNIPMDIKTPLTASITHKNSSMIKAIESVKNGKTEGIVSSGNTGALVSSSLRILKRLEKKGSFALTGDFPDINSDQDTLALDLGADISTTPTKLIKNTVMAAIFLKETRGIEKPRVGLIKSFKEKEQKQDTFRGLKELDLIDFIGYISPDDILDNSCDLILIDGFKGNILLKTAEGAAKAIMKKAKKTIKQKVLSIILGLSIQKDLELGVEEVLNKEIPYKKHLVSNIPSLSGNTDTILIGLGDTELLETDEILGKIKKIVKHLKEKGIENPKIGVANIGTEKGKGRIFEKTLFEELNKVNLGDFKGFIEPDKLLDNDCNIVITDKETGEIILKTMKGIIKNIIKKITLEVKNGKILGNIIGKNTLKDRLSEFVKKTENGANLLGANGTVVKAHGGAGPDAFCNAILVAYDSIKSGVIKKTRQELEKLKQKK